MDGAGCLSSSLHSPQPQQSGGTGWWEGLDRLGEGEEKLLGGVERSMGCPFLSIILEVDLLSPHNFSSRQNDLPEVQCEDGVLGSSKNSISVSELSGTSLAHHRVWGAAKDPTVIQVSFFPAK